MPDEDDRLAWLCHVLLEGGPEAFETEIADLRREELAGLLVQACEALVDVEARHERELRRVAGRLRRQ